MQKRLAFLYPEYLFRLKTAYPHLPERVIRTYFKGISKRIEQLNQQPEIFANFFNANNATRFIAEELLPEDSSALQFGKVNTALLYTEDLEKIKKQYYNIYLSLYEPYKEVGKKDDAFLLKKYKDELFKKSESVQRLFDENRIQRDFVISLTEEEVFKFDLAWQNGSTNLITPLSFDLQRKESIIRKATFHFGKFTLLEDIAFKNNYQFDLLIAKPRKPELFKYYDKAVGMLQRPKRVAIIEEEEIDKYADKTLQTLLFRALVK
ncbi:MAG: hypothetical protein OHK0038_06700 [Flammeovirgaceae bacterium]